MEYKMKTYQEFITESTQKRVEGGYVWIEQLTPPSETSTGSWKITVDGPGGKRKTIKEIKGYYDEAKSWAGSHVMQIKIANPDNVHAAKAFRRIGNKLYDAFLRDFPKE
ncbi:Ip10 [Shigella phage SP18]|uniref:Ip10 n=1 Tax=Shigella phage SP18 TaxID=645664 RepID=E3SFL3_BPSP8|nr:Ip10 [Shigella phage SP18]ADO19466.1 Ip10 [Shigella phage SP18]